MDLKKIKQIMTIFENSKINEMELQVDDFKIRLTKALKSVVSETGENKLPENIEEIKEEKISLKSPIVGTFYSASSPKAKPFVKVNQKVNENDVVCIIEAMKVMNEIKAGKKGIIREILVSDGELVQFDQPLMIIEEADD